jgi:hypothetical protein
MSSSLNVSQISSADCKHMQEWLRQPNEQAARKKEAKQRRSLTSEHIQSSMVRSSNTNGMARYPRKRYPPRMLAFRVKYCPPELRVTKLLSTAHRADGRGRQARSLRSPLHWRVSEMDLQRRGEEVARLEDEKELQVAVALEAAQRRLRPGEEDQIQPVDHCAISAQHTNRSD